MAQAEQRQQPPPQPNRTFSADLLARLVSTKSHFTEPVNDGGEIELSLGLSLNGRFGTDPRTVKNDKSHGLCDQSLRRSSSISDFALTGHQAAGEPERGLGRTCSLPAEAEDEWRRRKEIQSLRRLEAKRKRSEKQRNNNNNNKVARLMVEPPVVGSVANGGGDRKAVVLRPQLSFQGSAGSHGSGSSGLSESESLAAQGGQKSSETRSPASVHSTPDSGDRRHGTTAARLGSGDLNNNKKASLARTTGSREMARTAVEDMPCVSTTGLGPEGKRIEGFLYRYRKGEEVRIVCVCHGSFLSPAEFVKHAGSGDVDHPLKHIVVNPAPFL